MGEQEDTALRCATGPSSCGSSPQAVSTVPASVPSASTAHELSYDAVEIENILTVEHDRHMNRAGFARVEGHWQPLRGDNFDEHATCAANAVFAIRSKLRVFFAQAIEAQRAATLGAVHESAVAESDVSNTFHTSPKDTAAGGKSA